MIMQKQLSNGIRLIVEPMPSMRSVALGIWTLAGSVDERAAENGVSHFIEHMMFKGTAKRSARDISVAMDAIGAQLNAFTSKECTCYYVKVLDDYLEMAVDVIADMFLHSVYDPAEMEKEKGVIIEEIHMNEDSPEDLTHEILAKLVHGRHAMGRPILGTPKTLSAIDRDVIVNYMARRYRPENIVISVAGAVDADKIQAICERYFSSLQASGDVGKTERNTRSVFPGAQSKTKRKSIEQTHLCLAFPGVSLEDRALYTMMTLNNIVGGGMSSRLFQSVREERGLAYSVYSYPIVSTLHGALLVYAGTTAQRVGEAVEAIEAEIRSLCEKGIGEKEFEQSKMQLRSNFMMGLESTSARMNAIGKNLLLLGRVITEEETLRHIDDVTMKDVKALIEQTFDFVKMQAVLVGKLPADMSFLPQ